MTTVRAALVQTTWTGDKESMIEEHEDYARQAAVQGAQVICFQELFYGPYFCQVQDPVFYDYAESIPGPTTERFQALAPSRHGAGPPDLRAGAGGLLYNTAAVVDADGIPRQYRKTHIPQVKGFWEKFYFRPGISATRSSTPLSARSASTSATTATSPRAGGRSASTAPSSCSTRRRRAGACRYLWQLEQPASAVANDTSLARSTASASKTSATTTSTARATSSTPRASSSATPATARSRAGRARPRHGPARRGPQPVGLLPRPPPRRLRGLVQP